MVDTHCHLDASEFDPDRDEVLERARAAGVDRFVVPAIGPQGWPRLTEWSRRTPGTAFGLGIHPQILPEIDPRDDDRHLADLEALLAQGGAIAVGECGVDASSAAAGVSMARQVTVLRAQLRLARRFGLPAIIHCLRAHDALLEVLAEEPLPSGGVLHSFSGSAEQVRAYAAFDLHFSFAGPVTYEGAKKPLAAVQAIPRRRLLLETDAPDQTPRPHRGRNEPALLPLIAGAVARAVGVTLAEIDALTTENARTLFRLSP